MTPTPEKESEKMKPIAWLCEFVREDDSIDRQVVMEDPEGTRWADMPDGDGVSPYRVTPLYASPSPRVEAKDAVSVEGLMQLVAKYANECANDYDPSEKKMAAAYEEVVAYARRLSGTEAAGAVEGGM